jgi:hypothetical protein
MAPRDLYLDKQLHQALFEHIESIKALCLVAAFCPHHPRRLKLPMSTMLIWRHIDCATYLVCESADLRQDLCLESASVLSQSS